jgi:outer membrane lipoprotein LolB
VRYLFLLLVLAGLAACESVPVKPLDNQEWQLHQKRVDAHSDWLMQGRVAIRYGDDGGQGLLHWRQQGESYDLRFYDALNRLQLHIEGGSQGVLLHARDQETHEAADAETLMQEYLGWSVPVNALHYWVRGLPVAGQPVGTSRFSDNRLEELIQGDWHILYQRYEQVDGVWMPDLMRIEAPDLTIKLVVEKWSLS